MERYFPKVAKASSSSTQLKKSRYHPYGSQLQISTSNSNEGGTQQLKHSSKLSIKELNKGLLRSLASEHNPITHSDAGDRADHVVSVSTGHQVSEERQNRRFYLQDREMKLNVQRASSSSSNSSKDSNGVLRSVKAYLSGYLEGTTDLEMKRIIHEAGGQTVMVPSQCTHIVTSQWLSGSKAHKLLTTKTRNNPHVVRPEWVFDSIAKAKRQPERAYVVVVDRSHKSHEL